MNMKEYAFGIDLGGTTAKVGLFTTAGALLEKWEVPTDTSNAGEHILGNLAKAVKDKMQENGITAEQVEGVGQNAAVLLRLRRSQRYSALRLLPATVRLHTFTATAAATQRTRQTTRVCRTATLQCV